MADLESVIDDVVQGDDCDIIRQVTNIPIGSSLTDAWLSIKENHWDTTAIITKHITTTPSASGHIEDTGSGDTVGIVRFRLAKEETIILHEHFTYDFDVQVKNSNGGVSTPESGKFTPHHSVTSETS